MFVLDGQVGNEAVPSLLLQVSSICVPIGCMSAPGPPTLIRRREREDPERSEAASIHHHQRCQDHYGTNEV